MLRLFIVSSLLIVSLTACDASLACSSNVCSDYVKQSSAQQDLASFPEECSQLDLDGDGEACNEVGNGVTECPTTSACGCSNYNMDQCSYDPCCAWTVGEGCNCAPGA